MYIQAQDVMKVFSQKSNEWNRKNKTIKEIVGESERLLKILPDFLKPGMRILDVGSGTGKVVRRIHELEPKTQVFSVDLSYEMIHKLRMDKNYSDIELIQSDAQHLPFRDNCFDLITAQQLIHHLAEPHKFIQEVSRILKPSGMFLLLAVSKYYQQTIFPWNEEPIQSDLLGRVDESVLTSWIEQANLTLFTTIHDYFEFKFESFDAYFDFMDSIGALNRPFNYNQTVSQEEKRDFLYYHCKTFIDSDGGIDVPGKYYTLIAVKEKGGAFGEELY